MKTIVISGGTGLIGSHLTSHLKDKYKLIVLTRSPEKYHDSETMKYAYWDGKSTISSILEGSNAIVNLIGENIGKKRWTDKEKQQIILSRIQAADAIKLSIQGCETKPNLWLQASATGYYGNSATSVFDENSPKGYNSFLADVCEQWERPIQEFTSTQTRQAIIRTGVVLASKSELWKQLNLSFRFGVAAIPGNGKQHLPWIHIEDEVRAITHILENEQCTGIFNLAAPTPTTMREVIEAIKKHRKSFITLPVPRFIFNLLFGKEKTDEIILTNQHVTTEHLLNSGFEFKYSSIEEAVSSLIQK